MRRRNGNINPPKVDILKIDKDCFCKPDLNRKYIETAINTCRRQGVKVIWIKSTRSRHGMHYYIKIDAPIDAEAANNLQYILGDDAKRVAFNRARIESELQEWNKLFEKANATSRTVYRSEKSDSKYLGDFVKLNTAK